MSVVTKYDPILIETSIYLKDTLLEKWVAVFLYVSLMQTCHISFGTLEEKNGIHSSISAFPFNYCIFSSCIFWHLHSELCYTLHSPHENTLNFDLWESAKVYLELFGHNEVLELFVFWIQIEETRTCSDFTNISLSWSLPTVTKKQKKWAVRHSKSFCIYRPAFISFDFKRQTSPNFPWALSFRRTTAKFSLITSCCFLCEKSNIWPKPVFWMLHFERNLAHYLFWGYYCFGPGSN